ncbi:MAG: right-handed parallel beta-helix repeat-containing protein [Flavobacteriales bacterium]
MRSRTLTLLTCTALLASTAQAQLQRIVLQGGGAPQVFTDINAALAVAQPNDRLYFSGGSFTSATDITIGMPLHFIGAGINPDSTGVTSTTTVNTGGGGQDIIFTTAASGSTFTGIRFDPSGYLQYGTSEADDDPTGMVFQRCEFPSRHYLGINPPGASSSTLFDECVFHSFIWGFDGVSATFTRSIFDVGSTAIINFDAGGLFVSHCVFLGETKFDGNESAVVENCVFTFSGASGPLAQCNNATVSNCIFTSPVPTIAGGLISVANQVGVPAASIFVNQTDGSYQYTDDLHLAPGSGGIGGADDGTDIGLYGSGTPYKAGAVPFNPHFRAAVIANSTNANGDLPVNIRVAAQPN